jgi:hypothetical protein
LLVLPPSETVRLARLQGVDEVLQHQVAQVAREALSLGPAHLLDGFLGPLAIREVAGHLREAEQVTFLV